MIPSIKKITQIKGKNHLRLEECWIVRGKYGRYECYTLSRAIRIWLWQCGMPASIAYLGDKKIL